MNIIIFILVLGILIFVHELGHFLCAKLFKIRVDEFGFGYPPRMFKMFSWKGTRFTMNWIPFGGFVKIFGESDDGSELSDDDKKVSLVYKPRWQQALVMFGGILFNVIFAWILFTGIFMAGVQAPIESAPPSYQFESSDLTIVNILHDSPAEKAGLKQGDIVKEFYVVGDDTHSAHQNVQGKEELAEVINQTGAQGYDIGLVVMRDNQPTSITVDPQEGIITDTFAIGIALETIGELKLPFHRAAVYALRNTAHVTYSIITGFGQLFTGNVSLDDVSGPVGIVSQVGQASTIGLAYLIGFTALLSLNLAVLNLVPFPALDGGRLFILLIESIIRRRLPANAVNWVNAIGFFILIGLMILVTTKDVIKLF